MLFIKNNLKLFTFALLNSIIGVTLIFVFYLADANKLRATPPSVNNFKLARKSVVHIKTTVSRYSYSDPWQPSRLSRAAGTGFIIEGKRVLTNAHVVSDANTIRLRRPNQLTDFEAEVMYIAHDCDLALLSVKDENFFNDSKSLKIGDLPTLNSAVDVIGFPIGGDRISITKGIVSRIDMDVYSHSGVDYHLIIQVDAAINSGNSGGPAIQNGEVIGVAFQALSNGENLGYLIPPQVIKRFLVDVEDNRYDGYTEFGGLYLSTTPTGINLALGLDKTLKAPETGVLIYGVIPGSSADGYLKQGDVLFKVNGKMISENGDVKINGSVQNYGQLVDNLYLGDIVNVEIIRSGKRMKLSFPSRITKSASFQRRRYDGAPSYLLAGGLLFQPMTVNLMYKYRNLWSKSSRFGLIFRYDYFLLAKIYKEVSEDVVLTRRLSDEINIYADEFLHRPVKLINGEKIKGFFHFYTLFNKYMQTEEYIIINFHDFPSALFLRTKDIAIAEKRIASRYGIPKNYFISPYYKTNENKTSKDSKTK